VYFTSYLDRRHQVRHRHGLAAVRVFQLSRDALVGNDHLVDLVLGEQLLELAVGQDFDGLYLVPPLLQRHDGDQREHQVGEVELRAAFHEASLRAKSQFASKKRA
jgi:hypothetical protein